MKPEGKKLSISASARLSNHLEGNAQRILELTEGMLDPVAGRVLQAHMESCTECRSFWLEARQLELDLQRGIHAPALSPDFVGKVFRQIEMEASSEAAPERLRRKADLAAEYTAFSDQLKRQFLRPSRLLDVIGYAFGIGMSVYFLVILCVSLQSSAETTWQSIASYRAILVPTITGGAIALGALLFAARNRNAPWDEAA